MRKISLLNFKGGVAKSTTAINLGHALALEGKNILLVDCDLQANTSTFLPEPHKPTLTHVLREQARPLDAIANARANLDILPADGDLDKAARYIASEGHQAYYILQRAMKELERLGAYDFVFFDHSPSYSAVSQAALLASDEMLIPCELGSFSIEGLLQMFEKLQQTLTNHTLAMTGILPTKLNTSIAMHKSYVQDLQETFSGQVLPPIRQDAEIGKAQSYHQSIYEYNPRSRAAEDYKTLAHMLLKAQVTA